jgi:hypothetical protein
MTKTAAQLNAEIAAALGQPSKVDAYVTKYMGILGIRGERPIVKLRSNLGSTWLGRDTWSPSRPHTTLLEIQSSIAGDDRTLERVVAHEMVHHRDSLAITAHEIAMLKVGIKPESHGASFREGAARINAIMGPDFVTTVSDKEYKHAPSSKEFVVLITPVSRGRFGFAWAARLGPKAKDVVDELVGRGSRMVHTTDVRWTKGVKIARYGGCSVPKDDQDIELLRQLYEAAA